MALVLDCGSPAGHRLRLGGPGLALGTVPSGRRPALIGTRWRRPAGRIDLARCSSRGAGPALGALPAFPGVGTPRGNGFSCGCGKALPPSTWRRPKSRGVALAVGRGVWRLETHSQPVPHPGEKVRRQGPRGFQVREAVGRCVPLLPFYTVCVAHRFGTPPYTYTWGHCCPSKLRDLTKSEVLCPGSGLRL